MARGFFRYRHRAGLQVHTRVCPPLAARQKDVWYAIRGYSVKRVIERVAVEGDQRPPYRAVPRIVARHQLRVRATADPLSARRAANVPAAERTPARERFQVHQSAPVSISSARRVPTNSLAYF